jgi:DNA-binding NarL/FixJ family response regulator
MTKLVLVEDHAIFAGVLVQALEQREDLNVVMVVDTAEKALKLIPDLKLDLILVDVSLPKMNGIDLVGKLTQKRALAAGARGYVVKDSAKDIIEGIYQVLRGEIYVSKALRTP